MKAAKGSILFGFGLSKLMLGGITLCSNARTVFIRLVVPEAPSEWPTFGFTCCILASSKKTRDTYDGYRSNKDPVTSEDICKGRCFQRITNRSTGPMTLDECGL